MSGFIGFFGKVGLDLRRAADLLSHRGCRLHAFEDDRFGIAMVMDSDNGLFTSEHVTVAVSGNPYYSPGRLLSARELADEYLSSGTVQASTIFGTFSFVIFDSKAERVLLYRDAIGITPLYVMRLENTVYFATEYKALLNVPGFHRQIDVGAVNHFLSTGWNVHGTTFFCDIRPVQPGRLVAHAPNATILNNPMNRRIETDGTNKVTSDDLLAALDQSIDSSLAVSGPNIGIMLSGGVDSALIAALLKRKIGEKPIRSFTVGYGESDPEIIGARQTAHALGLDHSELILSLDEFDKLIAPAIWTMENVCGFDEYPCLFGLLQSVKGTVDTVFSGNFSDTIFAGMATHRKIWEDDHVAHRKSSACEDISNDTPEGAELVSDPWTYPALSRNLTEELSRALRERDERMSAQELFVASIGAHFILPYAHPAVINVAMLSTDAQKLSAERNKIILRDAASNVLPSSISERQKHIQQMPYDRTMQDYLLHQLDGILCNSSCISRRYLRDTYLIHTRSLLKRHINVTSIQKAWNIIAFETWCRLFLPS
ncbi:asparagine synthetase B family protein [Rhizobium sp. LEGMi198b]